MRRPLKLATLIAVALAFTACTDSPDRGITEPGGARLAHLAENLTPALDAVFHDASDLLDVLYACAGDKQNTNKFNDLGKAETFALAGWWTPADNPDPNNVKYMIEKIIANTDGLIAKTKGDRIPASCPGFYANATERDAIRTELYELLNIFKNQGDYEDTNVTATSCDNTQTCTGKGNNGSFVIPPGTFDYDVIVVIKKNNGSPPDGFTPAPNSPSVHFDVFPPGKANSPWSRYICYAGANPDVQDNDPPQSWIVLVRERGPGEPEAEEEGPLEYFVTEAGDECTLTVAQNFFLKGAYKLLAGLPIFPKTLHAYVPSREFGGPSPYASPHWLDVVPPDPALAELRAKTIEYYGDNTQNKNAALRKLVNADACETDACWNQALAGFVSNVEAQTKPPDNTGNKVLTYEQGTELVELAEALMR